MRGRLSGGEIQRFLSASYRLLSCSHIISASYSNEHVCLIKQLTAAVPCLSAAITLVILLALACGNHCWCGVHRTQPWAICVLHVWLSEVPFPPAVFVSCAQVGSGVPDIVPSVGCWSLFWARLLQPLFRCVFSSENGPNKIGALLGAANAAFPHPSIVYFSPKISSKNRKAIKNYKVTFGSFCSPVPFLRAVVFQLLLWQVLRELPPWGWGWWRIVPRSALFRGEISSLPDLQSATQVEWNAFHLAELSLKLS